MPTKDTLSQKQESKLSKATRTWLISNYSHKLLYPNDKRAFNRADNCVKYLTRYTTPNKELIVAATSYFYKNKQTIKTKLQRIKNSPKLKTLIAKYPKFNIEQAYKYAVLHDKLSLTQNDIDFFENLIKITYKRNTPKQ